MDDSCCKLLTIAQKDEQYCTEWLNNDLQELGQRLLGVRKWIKFRNAITILARFGYFSATTLSNINTPGEEFCDVELSQSGFIKRLFMVLFNNEIRFPNSKWFRDIHYLTFFVFGDFFELSKRITNFHYDNLAQQSKLQYKLIGLMSLIRLFIDVSKKQTTELLRKSSIENYPQDQSTICHLCSEMRTHPSSLLCGHIFCWFCIHQWLKERSECPICRQPTEASRVVYLVNFR